MRLFTIWLQKAGLQRQLSVSVAVGVIVIALLSSLASTWFGSRQIRRSLEGQGEHVTAVLAAQSTLALLYGSADNAADAAKSALAFPDVSEVAILLPDGKPLLIKGQGDRLRQAGPVSVKASDAGAAVLEAETDQVWQFIAPVVARRAASPFDAAEPPQELLGYVRVVQSKATLTRMMREVLAVNLAMSALFAVCSALFIRYLAGKLTRPLVDLATAMARTESGETAVRATPAGPPDIARMAKGFNRMIAALEERELALIESQHRYIEVVEAVKEVIFQTDANGRWLLLNPAWRDVTGFDVDATIGTSVTDFLFAEDRPLFESWQQKLRDGELLSCRYTVRLTHQDSSLRWIELTQRVRYGQDGEYLGTAGTFDDISERKHAEQQLDDYRSHLEELVEIRTDALQAANRELEAFSYSVSHDLRAPLRRVNGFSHMLEEDYGDKLDETGRTYLSRIRGAIETMDKLIEALLALAKVSRSVMSAQLVDLSAVAQGMADDLVLSDPLRRAEFRIQSDISCIADTALIRIVLQNLLGNAWKYSGKREKAVIEFGTTDVDNETVYFVRDNGAGFDMAHANKLFGTFQRLHSDKEFEGTGVGLATVQRIINRHGGRIWAVAAPDRGATFSFTLHLDRVDSDQPLRHLAESHRPHSH